MLSRIGAFAYHEWGATASGKFVKDKTFSFGGFQQDYQKVSETALVTVPSLEMLAGKFSVGGSGLPIYNPHTTRLVGSTWTQDPFPGNIIPANLSDPVSRRLINTGWRECQVTAPRSSQSTEHSALRRSGPNPSHRCREP